MNPEMFKQATGPLVEFVAKIKEMKGKKHEAALIMIGHLDNILAISHELCHRMYGQCKGTEHEFTLLSVNATMMMAIEAIWGDTLTKQELIEKSKELKKDFDAFNKLAKEAENTLTSSKPIPIDPEIKDVSGAGKILEDIMSKAVPGPDGKPH